ncbi:MAG: hypothetical protein NTW86_08950 [Candidatus Sumerlaeota bacterium]|nr:hypothetical protein [Candidatus Sumerlaeota bacterium]
MFRELQGLLAAAPAGATLADYRALVIADNALGKRTGATRRLTFQRLSELYALNPRSPLFRVLRSLWQACPDGCPILALFCALARDPLLRMTAPVILESAST